MRSFVTRLVAFRKCRESCGERQADLGETHAEFDHTAADVEATRGHTSVSRYGCPPSPPRSLVLAACKRAVAVWYQPVYRWFLRLNILLNGLQRERLAALP